MNGRRLCAASVVIAVGVLLLGAAEARRLTAMDLVEMPRVQEVVASPVGTQYVVTVNTWDRARNKKTQTMYLGDHADAGKALVALDAQKEVLDSTPVWAPDGQTVFFLSSRGAGVWAIDVSGDASGAKAYRVVNLPVDADTLRVSPKGTYLAFTSFVYPGLTLAQTAAKDAARAASRVSAQVWTETFVRRWDQYWDGKFSHVHYGRLVRDAATGRYDLDAATVVDVMGPQAGDCPQRPFGGVDEYSWSADEAHIAYTTQLGRDKGWSTDTNVWEYTLATGERECLTAANTALDTAPVYSADGRTIAYLAMQIPGYESDQKELRLYDRATRNVTRVPTPAFDRGLESLAYDRAQTGFYATAEDEARQRFFHVDVATQTVRHFAGEHAASALNVVPCADDAARECALFIESQFAVPAEVYVTRASGDVVRLTTFTRARMADIEMTRVWNTHFTGAGGDTVQAWVHAPYGWREGDKKKYPVVLYIHGGPESPWLDNFHYRWNPQVVAAMGYVVLAPNFHGSGSFGKRFTMSILEDWGGKPFEDLMRAVDHLGATFRFADTANIGAMGASYGGYMINWINSQTTRFKCLVCHDGVFNTAANYWETEELYFPTIEFGGVPTDHHACYKKWSPSTYADKMVTPELIFHGGRDYRIADVAGISVFNNLQRRGIDSMLVRYPDENHWVTKPANSLSWHDHVEAWLAKYLKN